MSDFSFSYDSSRALAAVFLTIFLTILLFTVAAFLGACIQALRQVNLLAICLGGVFTALIETVAGGFLALASVPGILVFSLLAVTGYGLATAFLDKNGNLF